MHVYVVGNEREAEIIARHLASIVKSRVRYDDGDDAERQSRVYTIDDDQAVIVVAPGLTVDWEPKDYDAKWERWRLEDLPIIPPGRRWKRKPRADAHEIETLVGPYLRRATRIINASRSERGTFLALHDLFLSLRMQAPIYRMPTSAYDPISLELARTAITLDQSSAKRGKGTIARSRADWLVGHNISRWLGKHAESQGYKVKIRIGRVSAAMLSVLAARAEDRTRSQPIATYSVRLAVEGPNGPLVLRWTPTSGRGIDVDGRVVRRDVADAAALRLAGVGTVTIDATEEEETREAPPPPLVLWKLQRDLAASEGHKPHETLAAAEQLAIHQTLISWPRFAAPLLPRSSAHLAERTINAIITNLPGLERISKMAHPRHLRHEYIAGDDDNAHAIYPLVMSTERGITDMLYLSVYESVCRSYFMQLMPDARRTNLNVRAHAGEDALTATMSWHVDAGWRLALSSPPKGRNPGALAPNMVLKILDVDVIEVRSTTAGTPPIEHYTLPEYWDAINDVAKTVRSPELIAICGEGARIGTDSTQANQYQDLITRAYVEVDERGRIRLTKRGRGIYDALKTSAPELCGPALTAIFDRQVEAVATGQLDQTSFLDIQIAMITEIVARHPTFSFAKGWDLTSGATVEDEDPITTAHTSQPNAGSDDATGMASRSSDEDNEGSDD